MSFIKTEQLSFDYLRRDENNVVTERISALKNINLEIEDGEFVALVGRNGSGKSTFARLLNALELPSEGRIFVDGLNTAEEQNIWEIRQRVGMVFQNPDNQMVASIVDEEVAFGPENIGVPADELPGRVERALNTVHMLDYINESPSKLSGGQKQRIAIAGVLAMQPRCIIFDEATAMLDPQGRDEIIETISELNRAKGITVIMITHYMQEAALAKRMIVFNKGEVVMDDSPRKLFARIPEIKELGLELPPAAALAQKLRESGVELATDIISTEELLDALCK